MFFLFVNSSKILIFADYSCRIRYLGMKTLLKPWNDSCKMLYYNNIQIGIGNQGAELYKNESYRNEPNK